MSLSAPARSVDRIPEVVSWVTWAEVNSVVTGQLSSLKIGDPSLRGTVERLTKAVSTAITIHS